MATKSATPEISKRLDDNVKYLNRLLGIGQGPGSSWDIMAKQFAYGDLRMMSYVLNGYFLTMNMVLILQELEKHVLVFRSEHRDESLNVAELVNYLNKNVGFVQVQTVTKMEDAIRFILSGPLVTFIDGFEYVLMIDTRIYPMRNIGATEVEKVIRGPRDGFVETMLMNTALIRRRLRDPSLRAELIQVGTRSKTDVTLMYVSDVADSNLVAQVRKALSSITADVVAMGEQAVMELMGHAGWNPYPVARYTERPDIAATALADGHVVIVVDTSPEVIIAPITLFQLLQHPEEYHTYPLMGTYLRWLTLVTNLISVVLPGVVLLVNFHTGTVPGWLQFFKLSEKPPMPLWVGLLFAEFALDMLQKAVLNIPTNFAAMVSIIAAFAFEENGAKFHFMPPAILMYLAFVLVAQLSVPSYEVANANRMSRFWIIGLTQIAYVIGLHSWGFVLAIASWVIFLATRKSFGVPYLWPLLPFKWKNGLVEILSRRPMNRPKKRSALLHPKTEKRS